MKTRHWYFFWRRLHQGDLFQAFYTMAWQSYPEARPRYVVVPGGVETLTSGRGVWFEVES